MFTPIISTILDTPISMFCGVKSNEAVVVTMGGVLESFKTDRFEANVKLAREVLKHGDCDAYKAHKAKLPVFTFSGQFSGGHKKTDLVAYSNVIVLDIDGLSEEEMARVKKCLKMDDYVFSFWESPSGNGIKGLVYIIFEPSDLCLDKCHKNAFDQLKEYFAQKYNITLDRSGSDFSRLCFACWDEELVLKEDTVPFKVRKPEEKIRKRVRKSRIESTAQLLVGIKNIKGRNDSAKRTELETIIRYLKKRKLSITNTYQDWLEVAFAIVSSFNPDLGKKYFIQLSQLDSEKYNEALCLKLLDNCYKTSKGFISFGSIVYKAQQKGYTKGASSVLKTYGQPFVGIDENTQLGRALIVN